MFANVNEPTEKGTITIGFSEEIVVPSNCVSWSNQNEGSDKMQLSYLPSDETEDALYWLDSENFMSWSVAQVSSKGTEVVASNEEVQDGQENQP